MKLFDIAYLYTALVALAFDETKDSCAEEVCFKRDIHLDSST